MTNQERLAYAEKRLDEEIKNGTDAGIHCCRGYRDGVKRVTENEEEGGRKGMTREEAIWRLENCLDCTDCFTCGSHDTALVMAVAALREQEERSKGCEFCMTSVWQNANYCPRCGRKLEVASDVITRSLTNADRIRAMSDEELAEFLYSYKFCDMCEEGCGECRYHGDCERRLAEWLKQPVKEDA